MSPTPKRTTIRLAKGPEVEAALALLLNQDCTVPFLAGGSGGRQSFDDFLVAERGGRLLGVVAIRRVSDRLAQWSLQTQRAGPRSIPARLLRALDEWLSQSASMWAVTAERCVSDELLAQLGYERIAETCYLDRSLVDDAIHEVGNALDFRPAAAVSPQRLAKAIASTFQGTLDCPALGECLSADDLLSIHRRLGTYSHTLWRVARHAVEDVGCVLLDLDADKHTCQLLYMGLAPRWRGRGWGRQLVEHACRCAVAHQARRIHLAVDVANTPAWRMYLAAGFSVYDSGRVYLKRPAAAR